MNFGKFDMILLMTMSLAIIVMSFLFPALGLVDDDAAGADDVPRFNSTAQPFDVAGDFPESPGGASTGEVVWEEDDPGDPDNYVYLRGDSDDGARLNIVNIGNATNPDVKLNFFELESGSVIGQDQETVTQEGEVFRIDNRSWGVETEVVEWENENQSDFTVTVDYELYEQPEDSDWMSRVPVVGGIFSIGEAVAQVLGYIAGVIFWTLGTLFEVSLTVVLLLFDVISFAVSLMHWLVSTYLGLVGGAQGFASVLVMVPGVLLFVEFMKLIMLGIKLLPTT